MSYKNKTTDDLQEILEVLNDLKGDDYKNNIDEIKERIRKATFLSKHVANKEMSTEDFLENPLNIIDSIQFRSNADKIKELIDNDEIISWDSIDEGNSFSNIFLSSIASGNEDLVIACCEQAKRHDMPLDKISLIRYSRKECQSDLDDDILKTKMELLDSLHKNVENSDLGLAKDYVLKFKEKKEPLRERYVVEGSCKNSDIYFNNCISNIISKRNLSACIGGTIDPLTASIIYADKTYLSNIIIDYYENIPMNLAKELMVIKTLENKFYLRACTNSFSSGSHYDESDNNFYESIENSRIKVKEYNDKFDEELLNFMEKVLDRVKETHGKDYNASLLALPVAISDIMPNPKVRNFVLKKLKEKNVPMDLTHLFEKLSLIEDHDEIDVERKNWSDMPTALHSIVDYVDDINSQDKYGATMLHWAVNAGDYRLANTLIEKGADTSIENNDGLNPLEFSKQLFDGYKEIPKKQSDNVLRILNREMLMENCFKRLEQDEILNEINKNKNNQVKRNFNL